ncbi:IS5 family transposase ISOt6 [Orientia tsutsugamushi]|uniref:IS5 family transposase ISOt6 n=1 Tax=Orientia tsutsugamushi TaxID=784 RepID=A0A2R8F1G3_ORITS|nr:IS5 family transposase ISOt6 [Orientia tsutsugamushi]
MKFDQIKELKDEKFRRLTGVRKRTFSKMVDILRKADGLKKSKGERKNKLNLEEQLLMALEYLREYRTYFHIGQNYGISESSAYKVVKWVEDTIVKHQNFAFPDRKALRPNARTIVKNDQTNIRYKTSLIRKITYIIQSKMQKYSNIN